MDNDELKRQPVGFRDHCVCGVVIHARTGLPKSIPYMGEQWLGHVSFVIGARRNRPGMRRQQLW